MTSLAQPGPFDAAFELSARLDEQLEGADPVVVAVSRALRRLDAILERRGWDAPASLWTCRLKEQAPAPDAPVRVVWDLVDTGDALRDGHPSDLLERLARYPGRFLPPVDGLVAIAFATEGWAPTSQEGVHLAADRQLHRNPDRVEVRMLSCVTTGDALLTHIMARHPVKLGRLETAEVPERPSMGLAMGGVVTQALRYLLERARAGK